jgi:hypothetical protein
MALPKIPKGLKSSIAKLERRAAKKKAIEARRKEIAALKAKRDKLRKSI